MRWLYRFCWKRLYVLSWMTTMRIMKLANITSASFSFIGITIHILNLIYKIIVGLRIDVYSPYCPREWDGYTVSVENANMVVLNDNNENNEIGKHSFCFIFFHWNLVLLKRPNWHRSHPNRSVVAQWWALPSWRPPTRVRFLVVDRPGVAPGVFPNICFVQILDTRVAL